MNDRAGPWDVGRLQQTPRYELRDERIVRDGVSVVRELYFDVEPFVGRPARAFAYLARPARHDDEPRLPAMLLIHGGGGTPVEAWTRFWSSRGYVALSMDLYGQGPNRQRMSDGGCDWSDFRIAFDFAEGVQNSWIYHSVATCLRAVSVLRDLPEVDASRIGVTGMSWGGYLTSTVMSIDDRVALGAPVFGAGFARRAGHAADAPEDHARRVYDLFDPSNYFGRCKRPVLFLDGTNDRGATTDELMQSYRAVRGPATLSVRVQPCHCNPQYVGACYEQLETPIFADAIFRGTDALVTVDAPRVERRRMTAGFKAPAGLFTASVHWTDQLDRPHGDRAWSSAYADKADRAVTGQISTDRPAIAFLTLVDQRGAMSSSEIVNVNH